MNLRAIILIGLVVLSLAAGAAKLLQLPHEVEFFTQAGYGAVPMVLLGCLQIVAAIMTVVTKTRNLGLLLLAVGFFISCIVIYKTGNAGFALGSLIPVGFAIWLLIREQMTAQA